MAKRRTFCPNHGVIEEHEMGAMYFNGPPTPFAYCPKCGAKTTVVDPENLPALAVESVKTNSCGCD